jgi:hypothetical protein
MRKLATFLDKKMEAIIDFGIFLRWFYIKWTQKTLQEAREWPAIEPVQPLTYHFMF